MIRLHLFARRLSLLSGIALLPCATGPARSAEPFRLITWNLHHGEGTDGKLDLGRIAEVIKARKPHAVALQEVDRNCARTGGVDQAAELGRLTGMTPVFRKAMDYDGGEYGLCFLTSTAPVSSAGISLPPNQEPRTAQSVTLSLPGGSLTLINTHLDFVKGPARAKQVEGLLSWAATLPGTALLAGDFNAVRGDEVMTAVTSAGWELPVKDGNPATVPALRPKNEIDFIALRPAGSLKVLRHEVLDEGLCSDHRPVLMEVIPFPLEGK